MWPNTQETTDLVTFTGEILDWKLHFLYSVQLQVKSSMNNPELKWLSVWQATVKHL